MATSRICTIPDCGKRPVGRGLCRLHYTRDRKKRQPQCSVSGCQYQAISAHGLCNTHYVQKRLGENPACKISGCDKPSINHGWCRSHYRRWLRHGDPLAGATYKKAAQKFLEDALTFSDKEKCLTWPFTTNGVGLAQIRVGPKTESVTRIICERTHGPPPSPKHQAAHSCGKGHEACVSPHHLSWKTQTENEADKIAHGTAWSSGTRKHPWAKLSVEQVREIRRLRKAGVRRRKVAAEFNITVDQVGNICSRRAWAWVGD